jgi:hypothetical protein
METTLLIGLVVLAIAICVVAYVRIKRHRREFAEQEAMAKQREEQLSERMAKALVTRKWSYSTTPTNASKAIQSTSRLTRPVTPVTRVDDDDAGVDLLTTLAIMNTLGANRYQPIEAPFISGGDGDGAGVGATGQWEPTPAPDSEPPSSSSYDSDSSSSSSDSGSSSSD